MRAVRAEAKVHAVFSRQPELHRFVIQDKASLADHIDRQSLTGELFITQITLYPKRGTKQYDEVYADIARAITQAVAELPEAGTWLRGRTFVRALH
ncbi:MAG TPA: hypothetical protein VNH16_24355 [Burkholderiales bacterium]|jgi:hypothetical protein|nr:hypothetical protein [Burkholderiales bacterium]